MTDEISNILNGFDGITLGEMDAVRLMNRVDTKFIFRAGQLQEVLSRLMAHYRLLAIEDTVACSYENLYFDTGGHHLYLQHHNGRLNRYKVRYRRYADTGLTFFELKFRNNHRRTIKQRILQEEISTEISESATEFLKTKSNLDPSQLHPALSVFFSRLTLVGKSFNERVTIDTGLRYESGTQKAAFPSLVIAEVKQEANAASPFTILMKQLHIRPLRISKYCLGTATLNPGIKQNSFKEKFRTLKKICNDQD